MMPDRKRRIKIQGGAVGNVRNNDRRHNTR